MGDYPTQFCICHCRQ